MSLRDIEFNCWKYFLAKAWNYTFHILNVVLFPIDLFKLICFDI